MKDITKYIVLLLILFCTIGAGVLFELLSGKNGQQFESVTAYDLLRIINSVSLSINCISIGITFIVELIINLTIPKEKRRYERSEIAIAMMAITLLVVFVIGVVVIGYFYIFKGEMILSQGFDNL